MSLLENSQNHQTFQGLRGSPRGQGKLKFVLLRMASGEMIGPPPPHTTESLTESYVP